MGSEHSSVLLGMGHIGKASQLLRPFLLAGANPHPGVHPHGHVLATGDCLVWAWGNATGDVGGDGAAGVNPLGVGGRRPGRQRPFRDGTAPSSPGGKAPGSALAPSLRKPLPGGR